MREEWDMPDDRDDETQRVDLRLDQQYQAHLLAVARGEARMRQFLAIVLVIGTLLIVAVGVALQQENLEKLSLLLAPVIGLTGIAVGYYFGRATPPRIHAAHRLDTEAEELDENATSEP
jgi:hypothetical protein